MLVLKNIISNFISRIWLILLSLVSVPYIINKAGADAYAILSMSLMVVGYFYLLDLGLGQGVIKFISEYNAEHDEQKIKELVGTSLVVYIVMGVVGALGLAASVDVLVSRFFKIPADLMVASRTVFYLTSVGVLFRIPQSLFSAIPAGYQKLYALNMINIVVNTVRILAIIVLLYLGYSIVAVVLANLLMVVVLLVVLVFWAKRILPQGSLWPCFKLSVARKIFSFSMKTFISEFMSVIITNVDKLLIGFFMPIVNLAYYTVSFDLANKIWVVPSNIVTAVYPALSERKAKNQQENLMRLYLTSSKLIMIGVSYLSIVIVLFAKQILTYWINETFAIEGAMTLRILGIGVFLSSSGWAAVNLANASGRPDIPAKAHLIMAAANICLCLYLIPRYGINGAAVAWLVEHLFCIGVLIPWVNKACTGLRSLEYFLLACLKPVALGVIFGVVISVTAKVYMINMLSLLTILSAGGVAYLIASFYVILNKYERGYAISGIINRGGFNA